MDQSPLLNLPSELRNLISELALYHPQGLCIRILTGKPQILISDNETPHNKNPLALTETCRQLRRETTSILYEVNKFTLIARPVGHRYNNLWQTGLRLWLEQIGERNRACLSRVEIDIGTSFMYDFYPATSETIWRSVSSLLPLFSHHHHQQQETTSETEPKTTIVCMKTEINWMSRSLTSFPITIPLNDSTLAREAVREALEQQRLVLELWCRRMRVAPRDEGYRRVELETCGQELRSFVSLLEVGEGGKGGTMR